MAPFPGALVLANLGAFGRWVGKWVWSSGLFLQHLVLMDSAFLLLSGFHHHHPSHLCPTKCLLPAPLTLSVGAELCHRWWRPSETQLIFRHLQAEGWILASPESWEPVGTVHCRSWFMALPTLSSPAPLSACWVLDLHYGLVEFLTILRWKPGARAPLVYKT